MLLLLAACSPLPPDEADLDGRWLVSDLRGPLWAEYDARTGKEIASFNTQDLDPEHCGEEASGIYCLFFQARERQAADGAQEVVFTWSRQDITASQDPATHLLGSYAAVDRDSGALRWRFDQLDWSQAPSEDLRCDYDPADPCALPADLEGPAAKRCRLNMPHDMQVLAEDDEGLRLWVADTGNNRILELELDRDERCAVVRDVLDDRHPEWDLYVSINSLEVWEEDGRVNALFTIKSTLEDGEASAEQSAGKGKGKVAQWRRDAGGSWSQAWEWPPERTDDVSFVNTPHGVARGSGPDGAPWVLFAQSFGVSEDWNRGTGGSVTVLDASGQTPAYLFDVLIQGRTLRFPRDVEPLPDGTFLVADSGCLDSDCAWPTLAWRFSAEGLEPGAGDGAYTPGGSRQDFREVEPLGGPILGEVTMLYSVEYLE